ncbi:hypothetical protein Pcinc_012137 [Petrolisthes cinctipes]|uniref:C-type lectin domain-containing protein n=1 Tax=Petrolisthes cinctipes TaxID=88211 RepID=A0AAE1FZN9_PETCI|nr:hypothetical protein Pcinc_012137 [Petrolisthes cinctipes]
MASLPILFLLLAWNCELVLARVGDDVDGGLYTCIRDPLELTYISVFVFNTPSGTMEMNCQEELHWEVDENSEDIYCFPPCLNTLAFPHDQFSLVVTGRDPSDPGTAIAFASVEVTFMNVTPSVSHRGGRVGLTEWQGRPGRSYQVQLWHDPEATRQDTLEHRTLHPRAQSILAASGMEVSVLQNPRSKEPRVVTVVELSDLLTCSSDHCVYYFPDLSSTGRYTLEVLDITESLVHSTRIQDYSLQPWEELTLGQVTITSGENPGSPKDVTVTLMGRLRGPGQSSVGQDRAGDYTALLINDLDHSQALESLPEDCLPLSGGCVVRGLEGLVDPDTGGSPSHLWLLLSSTSTASALAFVSDVQVGVEWAGSGSVLVRWSGVDGATQYSVRILPQDSSPGTPILVDCGGRAGACEATFSDLTNGNYEAEVSYSSLVTSTDPSTTVTTSATVSFIVANATQVCHLPFTAVGDKCLLVETVATGTWYEMNNVCHQLGGRLAILDGDLIFYHLVQYIKELNLSNYFYWLGASDEEVLGEYKWLDGTMVKLGTPFWMYAEGMQWPQVSVSYRCVVLHPGYFLYFTNGDCNVEFPAICEQLM